jgi:hypothetical protein
MCFGKILKWLKGTGHKVFYSTKFKYGQLQCETLLGYISAYSST